MTTPTQEQLRDPKWWDENVGPWAKLIAIETDAKGGFVRMQERAVAFDSYIEVSHPDNDISLYQRPTKPAAPDWDGEGLPPVGLTNKQFKLMTHISVACDEHPETEYQVVAHLFGKPVIAGKSFGKHFAHIVPASHCKPRDWHRETTIDHAFSTLSEFREASQVLGELYDAGLLRKGES